MNEDMDLYECEMCGETHAYGEHACPRYVTCMIDSSIGQYQGQEFASIFNLANFLPNQKITQEDLDILALGPQYVLVPDLITCIENVNTAPEYTGQYVKGLADLQEIFEGYLPNDKIAVGPGGPNSNLYSQAAKHEQEFYRVLIIDNPDYFDTMSDQPYTLYVTQEFGKQYKYYGERPTEDAIFYLRWNDSELFLMWKEGNDA
jgi:hypothetical protein